MARFNDRLEETPTRWEFYTIGIIGIIIGMLFLFGMATDKRAELIRIRARLENIETRLNTLENDSTLTINITLENEINIPQTTKNKK